MTSAFFSSPRKACQILQAPGGKSKVSSIFAYSFPLFALFPGAFVVFYFVLGDYSAFLLKLKIGDHQQIFGFLPVPVVLGIPVVILFLYLFFWALPTFIALKTNTTLRKLRLKELRKRGRLENQDSIAFRKIEPLHYSVPIAMSGLGLVPLLVMFNILMIYVAKDLNVFHYINSFEDYALIFGLLFSLVLVRIAFQKTEKEDPVLKGGFFVLELIFIVASLGVFFL